MTMRKVVALSCLYVAHFSTSASAQGEGDDSCDLGGPSCHVEDTVALLQRTVHEHDHRGFPDLGDLADQAKGIVGQASDAVNDLLAKGISTVGDTINTTLAKLDGQVSEYAAEVNKSADDLRLGMASLLSKRFNVSLPPGVPSGEEYEKVVKEKVDSAVALFGSAAKSVESALAATQVVPPGLEDLTKSLNSTLQTALSESESLLASLKDVQALVEDPQEAEKALLQADVDPKDAVAKVKQALQSASDQASSFANSFADSFGKLSDSALDATKGKLSADTQGTLSDTFDSIQATAKHLGQGVQQGVSQMVDGIGKGIDAAGIEGSGASVTAATRLGLLAALVGATAVCL